MITLKIQKGKNGEEAKTLTAESYELLMGTVEDFISIIDLDKLNNEAELLKMVMKGYEQIKPLIMDVFPELTSEEFKRVKVTDLLQTIAQIGTSVLENLKLVASKNRKRE